MAQLHADGEGGYLLVDDENNVWELLEGEDGTPAIEVDGEIIELNPQAIEEAVDVVDAGQVADWGTPEDYGQDLGEEAEQAWLGFLERQLVGLDQSLNRRLTGNEVKAVAKAAEASHVPNPDIGELYDAKFPGRRDSQDSNAKRQVITEIAQDHVDAAKAEEEAGVTPGWESEDLAADSE